MMIHFGRKATDLLLATVLCGIGGCAASPAPLAAQFTEPAPGVHSSAGAAESTSYTARPAIATQPSVDAKDLPSNSSARLAQAGDEAGRTQDPSKSAGPAGGNDDESEINPAISRNVTMPGDRARAGAATEPLVAIHSSTAPLNVGASSGEYYTVGGVVAEVNNTPIYANKILRLIEPVLSARAKELNPQQFRSMATTEIERELDELIARQLEYAAAERNLDSKDKELADLMTAAWRNQQINAAGGSLELARAQATANGQDFDELVQEQYRTNMARVYYQKKVWPRIVISASEMRQYYDAHRNNEFTQRGTARFALIKVDVRESGSRQRALERINDARNRIIKGGEPFDVVAHDINDDPRLRRTGGDLGAPIEKGAFVVDKVDQAVWATPAGQITPIIDAGDALYLAQVEEKKSAKVQRFDDPAVQRQIEATLGNEQFVQMRREAQKKLMADAIMRSNEQMLDIAVEMAMENYPRWARSG